MINTFVTEYINYINADIYKAVAYYKRNNKEEELKELNLTINTIYENVSTYFNKFMEISNVKKITRLGDMHGENNCTVLIDYKNKKSIYKPIHSHFLNLINQLLYFFNASNKFNFYCLKLISQNENGSYIEYIKNEQPNDINKFSYHYGAIIFIVTLLRGTDFHSENIFCKSSTPIIVDYETFFYPRIIGFKDYNVEATSLVKTKNNTHTLMNYYDLNLELVIEGINSAFDIVRTNKDLLLSLITEYHETLTRIIFKPTSYYMNILRNSTHPSLLSCKKRRKKYLKDCLIGENNISSFIMIYEIEDLLTFNIPAFYFEKGNLYTSKKKLIRQDQVFSSLELIHNNIKNLDFFKNEIVNILGSI